MHARHAAGGPLAKVVVTGGATERGDRARHPDDVPCRHVFRSSRCERAAGEERHRRRTSARPGSGGPCPAPRSCVTWPTPPARHRTRGTSGIDKSSQLITPDRACSQWPWAKRSSEASRILSPPSPVRRCTPACPRGTSSTACHPRCTLRPLDWTPPTRERSSPPQLQSRCAAPPATEDPTSATNCVLSVVHVPPPSPPPPLLRRLPSHSDPRPPSLPPHFRATRATSVTTMRWPR